MRSTLFSLNSLWALLSIALMSACNPLGQTTTIGQDFYPGVVLSSSSSTVTVSNAQVFSGSAVNVTVFLKDTNGVPYVSTLPTVSLQTSGGTSTGTFSSITNNGDGSYSASFTGLSAGTATTVQAFVNGSVLTGPLPTITVTSGNYSLSNSAVTVSSNTVASGSSINVTLTVKDALGNQSTSGGLSVAFSYSGGSSTGTFSAVTDQNNGTYTATFTGAVGGTPTSIGATIQGNAITSALPTVTVTSGAATSLVLTSVPASTTAGSPFSFTVTAKDSSGNIATGYAGTVSITSSDGSAVLPSSSTLMSGTKSFSITLKTAGSRTVTASDGTLSITSSSITVGAGAYDVTQSAVNSSSGTVPSGGTLTATLIAKDSYGNTNPSGLPSTSSIAFTSTSSPGSGSFGSITSVGSGVYTAVFTGATAGSVTLGATISSVAVSNTTAVTVTSGSATSLVLTSVPASTTAGSPFSVTVTAKDASGNTVTGYSGTVAITSSDGAAILPSSSTLTGGTKSFTITLKTAGSKTITASDGTFTVTSNSITVNPGTATSLVFTSQPSSVTAGTPFSVTVTAEDGAGNTATSYAGTVSITSSDSSAVLPSSSTLTSGVKAFSITLKTAPSQTVTASDGTLSRTSSAITVNAGAVSLSHSTFTLSQSTLTSGSTATATLVLKDSSGNQIADSSQAANLTFSVLTTGTSTGTLGAITPVGGNAGAYQATFTAKTSGTANTVSASLSGLGSFSATPSFTVSAGSASASVSTLSASPTSIPADGSTSSTITVTLLDSNSNPVSGKSITLASSRSGDVIAPASVTTLSNGVAQFTVKSTTAGSSSYTATDTTDASLVLSQQATVTFTAGLPSATLSTVVPNPTASVVANGTNTSIVTVTLLDTYSNPVQNKTVTLTSSRGATDTISAASGASNSSGQVTFTVSSTTVGTPVLTAKDTTDNITLSTQPSVTFIAGPAANIAIFSGNYQNTIPGSATASSMVVLVTDANSNPVNNAAVNWSVNNTADTLASSSSTTGANGQTSNTLTFNSSATTTGADTVTATLVSTGTNVTFTESVQVILAINNVKTSQGTTSTSFTNLTTLDAVSITVAASTQVVIEYYANIQTTGTATSEIFVDGTGIANSQISTADVPWSGNQYQYQSQALETITTLSAGTHTIAVEHASSSTSVTSSWIDRTLTVTHGSAVIASNFVATAQTIASGTIEDLATPDKVTFTLTQSTPIYVSYVAQALKSSIGTNYSYVYIDGVQEAVYYAATSNANQMQIAPYVTTLAAGTHTIDIQHECDDNNCTWSQRQLTVFYGSPVLLASSYVATSQTTTSTTFVDLATVDYVTFSLNAQQYVDIQYFDSNSNTAFTTCQSVVLVDGVEDTGTIAYQSSHAWSGNMVIQDRVQLSAGSHTIKVQHETASSSSCAFLGRLLTVKGSP